MTKKNKIKKDLEQLRKQINKHDYDYYYLDQPKISDYDYDQLFKKLINLEKKYPDLIDPNSPTQRVPGAVLPFFEKIPHTTPMLSLQNTYDEEEIVSFYNKTLKTLEVSQIEFFLEPKFDGIAVELVYQRGILVHALTRGDGFIGENIIENIKTIPSIPIRLTISPSVLEVRGEVFLMKTDFREINNQLKQKGESVFANPRNAAAGSVRQLNPKIASERSLKFFAHSYGFLQGIDAKSQSQFLKDIHHLGFPTLPISSFYSFQQNHKNKKPFIACVKCTNISEILEYFYIVENIRPLLNFEIDGMVIKVNSLSEQKKLGSISRYPRWAKAAKFQAETATTYIKSIQVQIGRTGVLTPVAELQPVTIKGVQVTHASLHNQSEIRKKDIRIGDEVIVGRAGDVIPEVIETVNTSNRKKNTPIFKLPRQCPSCSSPVHTERELFFCINPECSGIRLQALIHFVSKKAMNIELLGVKWLTQLYEKKIIKTPSDIYKISKDHLLSLERQGDKSATRILNSIEKSKNTGLPTFIFAMNIRYVGEKTAHLLSHHFIQKAKKTNITKSSKNFLNWPVPLYLIATASLEELKEIPEIGDVTANSIYTSFHRSEFIEEVEKLLLYSVKITWSEPKTKSLSGQYIAITGTLPWSRSKIENLISDLGGHVQSSVNKNTNFLLTGEIKGSGSQKLKRAKALNITQISWKEFQRINLLPD